MTLEQTIFIVDDERAVRESLAALLRAYTFRVELYSSAEEFLLAFKAGRQGCLVTDIRLNGGMTGLELQQALLARGGAPPTIIISGKADEATAQKALANGAICVLQKPVPYKVLLAHLKSALAINAAKLEFKL